MSGSSARRRSVLASEDRPRAIGDRAGVAGWVHGESAAGAERPSGGQDRLGLLREGDHPVVAEADTTRWGIPGGGLFALVARRALARNQDEHPAGFVVAEAHLA